MKKYWMYVLAVLILFPAGLQAAKAPLTNQEIEARLQSETEEARLKRLEENLKKADAFLVYYDRVTAAAKKNTAWQAKLKEYKNRKPSTVYEGPKTYDYRAEEVLVPFRKLYFETSSAVFSEQPSPFPNHKRFPDRYRRIDLDKRYSLHILYAYYDYLMYCFWENGRAAPKSKIKYLLSERMVMLLEAANEALLARDYPTYFGIVQAIEDAMIENWEGYKPEPKLEHAAPISF